MRQFIPRRGIRLSALALAVLTAAMCPLTAAAPIGDGVQPTCDEAYYAMLDYYGNLVEGSVVKSYILNGAGSVTDYGVYDEVVNLTDGSAPLLGADSATFQFEEIPSHFYFEGRTAAPFAALPWTLSVSYALNGVTARAGDLAGSTGVVEIRVDALPNENASEYARNNYTLEAMAVFNQDDILSLEAPGAQVQLVGNLRTVLFVALPGEEQHFVIRVGCEDFSFDGLTFLMVPATLSQLEEISKLSQRKEDLEADYRDLSGSLDELLDSFAGLGGSLRATADGLDALNGARNTLSQGKGQVYEDADRVLEDLERLSGSLSPLPDRLEEADQAVEEVSGALSDVASAAVRLQQNLDDVDKCLKDLQRDIRSIRSGSGSLEDDLELLGGDLEKLRDCLRERRETLELLDIELNGGLLSALPESAQANIKIQGQRLDELLAQVQALEAAWAAAAGEGASIGPEQFYAAAGASPALLEQIYTAVCGGTDKPMTKADFFTAMLLLRDVSALPADQQTPENIGKILAGASGRAATGKMLSEFSGSHDLAQITGLLERLSSLLKHLGNGGLTGDLSDLVGKTDKTLDHLDDAAGIGRDILNRVDSLLEELDALDSAVNRRVPQLRGTLQDARTLVSDLVITTEDTHRFLSSFRTLAGSAGAQLDAGVQESLDSLAETLRRTARSTDAVAGVRTAKDAVERIVEDTWHEYTGDLNNLLLMDAAAPAQSLTSEKNPPPTSVQVLIRTQEIQPDSGEPDAPPQAAPAETTFWDRVAQMFRDFWTALTGIFR